jgi:hypothetical protein
LISLSLEIGLRSADDPIAGRDSEWRSQRCHEIVEMTVEDDQEGREGREEREERRETNIFQINF